jgi:hypothetical protein
MNQRQSIVDVADPAAAKRTVAVGGDLRIELKVDRDDTICGQLEVTRHLNSISVQHHAPPDP